MLWVFIAASVLALGAIAYGVLRVKDANEALGLAQVKKWRKDWVPITIAVDDGGFLIDEVPRLRDAVKAAARFWNSQVGVTLFVAPTDIGTGAVVPLMRHDPLVMEDHESAVAYASIYTGEAGDLKRASIYMVNWENLPSTELARAMKHEFGHCLGLAHDLIEFSVMYGNLSRRVYCVSPSDKAFLREVYS